MRTFKVLFISAAILGIIYYQIDKHLFYYGRNDLHIYHSLPFKIEPKYRPAFEGGFALEDKYSFTIAAKGNAYRIDSKEILINKVLKYGFNTEYLVVLVTDINRDRYFIEFNRNQNNSSDFNSNIFFYDRYHNLNSNNWVDIDSNDAYIEKLVLFRNYLLFIVIILMLTLIYKLIKYKKIINYKKFENQI